MMEKEVQNLIHRRFLAHRDLPGQLAFTDAQFPE
jgi:hypothetical protein